MDNLKNYRLVSDGPIEHLTADDFKGKFTIDFEDLAKLFGPLSKKEERMLKRQISKKLGAVPMRMTLKGTLNKVDFYLDEMTVSQGKKE